MYLDTRNHQHLKLVMFCRPSVHKNLLFPRTSSRRHVDEHSKTLNIQQFFFRMLIWRWSQASVFLSQNLRRGGSLLCLLHLRAEQIQPKILQKLPLSMNKQKPRSHYFHWKVWVKPSGTQFLRDALWALLACFLFWKRRLQDSWEAFH